MTRERPAILYVVPGHDFLPSAGPTRNVLNQVRAMQQWADVTIAVRRIADPLPPSPDAPRVLEIAPSIGRAGTAVDDAATRGMGYREFAAYLRALRVLLEHELPSTDLVLEKDWMLTGYAAHHARRFGVPGIAVKNWIATAQNGGLRAPVAALRHALAAHLEGWFLRRATGIVAETETLRASIARRWRIDPARISVIGLGVDRARFSPGDQPGARTRLGIALSRTVLLYAGVLDRTHDLEPLLHALAGYAPERVELHVIGDGPRRGALERIAADARVPVTFHGRVPHDAVADYIAAADLCVAPYDRTCFPHGEVGYSTLKVREYLSAGRAVATVPSGALRTLVRHETTGFLLENDADAWRDLLRTLPPRERLREMGRAAAASELESWDDVGRAFQRLCAQHMAAPAPAASEAVGAIPYEARRI
ncbi:MAG TPA: glycosyltransferase family 4 protein [Gemmatimonadaceae bacterium]|nr:glycosyltransferase family 4 protein [Gemmatimonadaceae bacterium]